MMQHAIARTAMVALAVTGNYLIHFEAAYFDSYHGGILVSDNRVGIGGGFHEKVAQLFKISWPGLAM
jgi:phenylalanyl-tRNA synthetase beta subunit